MNKRDLDYIAIRFPHYYGRIDTTKIDAKYINCSY